MSLQQEVELLRKIPMFANIDPAKLKLLAFTSERLSYADGDILLNRVITCEREPLTVRAEVHVVCNSFIRVVQAQD